MALRDRFSGYQLPMIQLDSTGPQYVQMPPHPYFSHPEPSWQKPYYPTGYFPEKSGGIAQSSHNYDAGKGVNVFKDTNVEGGIKLWPYLNF